MVRITAGSFLIGASENQFDVYLQRSSMNFPGMEDALRNQFVIPARPDDLPRFFIEEFEVTNSEYHDFLQATGYQPEDTLNYLKHWENQAYPDWASEFPVVWVSVEDAQAYCEWRAAYLPTEEQWEKAARGGGGRAFPWGNSFPSPEMANFGREDSEPVGNRAGDVSPYLVYDLGGNVSEWTSSRTRLRGTEFMVARGGSFAQPARDTMSARRRLQRTDQPTERRAADLGFRCAAN